MKKIRPIIKCLFGNVQDNVKDNNMNITANKTLTLSQNVNTIGKYLYKNLAGAFDFKKSSNMFDVYTVVLYQIPIEYIRRYNLNEEQSDVKEMIINLNLTTYQDKIRFNVIEQDPDEMTLGCKVCQLSKYKNYAQLRDDIVAYLKKQLQKRYSGYEFLF